MFCSDRTHYSRWLSVHLFDLLTLHEIHPDVLDELKTGKFAFQKTDAMFSLMAIDQVHDQNNKVIKNLAVLQTF